MNRIPAFCQNCGAVFESGFSVGGPAVFSMTVRGNRQTCPQCGSSATVADARKTRESGIVLSGIPIEAIWEFQRLVKARYNNQITVEDFHQQSSLIDPQLGRAAAKLNSSPAISSALLAALMTLASCSQTTTTIEIKIDAAEIARALIGKSPAEITGSIPDPSSPEQNGPSTARAKNERDTNQPKMTNRSKRAQLRAKRRRDFQPNRK